MKNELVEYANQLNDLNLNKFNLIDKRIFFAILSQCRDLSSRKKVVLRRMELLDLGIYTENSKYDLKTFFNDLSHVVGLCYSMYFHQLNETDEKYQIEYIRLFEKIKVEWDKKDLSTVELHFKVDKEAQPFLDTVFSFTSFPLSEFQSLKSIYSQNLFIHLKQFRKQGKFFISQENFKIYLNIPKSYKQRDIDRRVLNPAIKELRAIFPNLQCKKIRDSRDRRKIARYAFYWDPNEEILPSSPSTAANKPPGKWFIPKGGSLPTWKMLEDFKLSEKSPLSLHEMVIILAKKAELEDISSWKAYLRGAAKNKTVQEKNPPIDADTFENEDSKQNNYLDVLFLSRAREGASLEDLDDLASELIKSGENEHEVFRALENRKAHLKNKAETLKKRRKRK